MTDFDRVRDYYRFFDEKNRLVKSGSGRLEYMMTMDLLKRCLPGTGTILDLGGGAGAYSFPLAAEGYKVFLADLSEELIQQAEEQNAETETPVVCNVVNATDLSLYYDGQFDVVLLMGSLYQPAGGFRAAAVRLRSPQGAEAGRHRVYYLPALPDRKRRSCGPVLRPSGPGERGNHQGGFPVRPV